MNLMTHLEALELITAKLGKRALKQNKTRPTLKLNWDFYRARTDTKLSSSSWRKNIAGVNLSLLKIQNVA